VLKSARETDTLLKNVVILAEKDTIETQAFKQLKSTPNTEKAFIAEVDPESLIAAQEELRDGSKALFVPYLGMITASLKLAFGETVSLENEFMLFYAVFA
jgi:hypothetical protein